MANLLVSILLLLCFLMCASVRNTYCPLLSKKKIHDFSSPNLSPKSAFRLKNFWPKSGTRKKAREIRNPNFARVTCRPSKRKFRIIFGLNKLFIFLTSFTVLVRKLLCPESCWGGGRFRNCKNWEKPQFFIVNRPDSCWPSPKRAPEFEVKPPTTFGPIRYMRARVMCT